MPEARHQRWEVKCLIGSTVILCEDGGKAIVRILSKRIVPETNLYPRSAFFRIRFESIIRQYPYVPYNRGEEIEISFVDGVPRQAGMWYFEEEEGVAMLNELKRLDVDGIDLEEAMALAMFGKQLRQEFEARNCDAPEWLDNRIRELGREIESKRVDGLERRLKKAQALAETLKPAEQKRQELEAEIASLKQQIPAQP